MIRVRVNVLGSGTDADPFRIDLPTYIVRAIDYQNLRAVVAVPPDDIADALSPGQIVANDDGGGGQGIQVLTPGQRLLWRAILRRRYGNISAANNADVT